jgi:hypothetical protein
MSARVIQNFVRVCADCQHCRYYSGGVSECTITSERISAADKGERLGRQCPLPYAGPPVEPAAPVPVADVAPVVAELREMLREYADACEQARSWGGPTMLPNNPINEKTARRFARALGAVSPGNDR